MLDSDLRVAKRLRAFLLSLARSINSKMEINNQKFINRHLRGAVSRESCCDLLAVPVQIALLIDH